MIRHWSAVEGDFAREYRVTAAELAAMSTRRFLALVGSLPGESRFARAWQKTPRAVTDPAEIAAITGNPAS